MILENITGFVIGTEWIWLIIIAAMIIPVIKIIRRVRKKKRASSGVPTSTQIDTQFWVCPNCGRDTQMKDGRQYCSSCKIYLSI